MTKPRNIAGIAMGSLDPTVVYVGFRCNGKPLPEGRECEFQQRVFNGLKTYPSRAFRPAKPEEIRIYNLLPPAAKQGMTVRHSELCDLVAMAESIAKELMSFGSLKGVIVGGKTGPMPVAAAIMKRHLGDVPVELRVHHAARPINKPLKIIHAF